MRMEALALRMTIHCTSTMEPQNSRLKSILESCHVFVQDLSNSRFGKFSKNVFLVVKLTEDRYETHDNRRFQTIHITAKLYDRKFFLLTIPQAPFQGRY